jgi:hydroxyquinol 1,2-dioxygenase
MRNVTEDTITEAFLRLNGKKTDPRLLFVLERLSHHLHSFARETGLTHTEWRAGLKLLMEAGKITDKHRNEFVLFSDVFGLSSLVDMINSRRGGTPSSVLGPFHILGAPERPNGARIELWQTAANGLYSNQDPEMDEYAFRAALKTDVEGRYAVSTVIPAPYTVPMDGPVGTFLKAVGRHPWRPSHLHFVVEAQGFRTLVTEVFPENDCYLDEDAVFGVREKLIMRYERHDRVEDAPTGFVRSASPTLPFYTVAFDFVLVGEDGDRAGTASVAMAM